jgi:SAM-dependent methyltransferase
MTPSPTPEVLVPSSLLDAIIASECESYRLLRASKNPEAELRANIHSYDFPFKLIRPYLSRFRDPHILELGSGNGLGLCSLLKRGLDVVGIEPGADPFQGRFEVAREILRANGQDATRLHSAVAEGLPFPANTFDIVFSSQVLEHVADPTAAMDEVLRVLTPGGVALTHVPNYDSLWEGHYGIIWIPYVLRSKAAARWYVRTVYRRDPSFVDTLSFVRPGWFKRWAMSRGLDIRVYPFLFNKLNKIAHARYILAQDLPSDYALLNWIRSRVQLRPIAAALTGVTTDVAARCGLAPLLTAVFTKPNASVH